MRVALLVLLVLLAANLAFLATQIYLPREDRVEVPTNVPRVEPLHLVSERPPDPDEPEPPPRRNEVVADADTDEAVPDGTPPVPPPSAGQEDTPPEPDRECFTLGPYREREIADATAAQIRSAGLPASRRSSVEPELRGYWVLIPPLATTAAADAIADQLQRRGVQDFFVTEEPPNAVSLGVFSQRRYAERRLRQMQELGYDVEIEPIYRDRTVYWLDYETRGDLEVAEQVWRGSVPDGGGIERLPRDCP